MENNDNETPLEVMAPSAIMAMEKAQIDIQIATAHQYPRSLEQFKKRALAMATLDPETAESCVYVRPVGKEQVNGKWVEKYAEGPSIRLAEIVAVSYGNIRAASRVVEQTERYVKCTGMAHDLESNSAMQADVIESTVTRDGKPYSERQRALIAKVCSAKAIRDAIFKIVPRALCKPIMAASKKVAQGLDRPLEERRKKAQAWIGTLKIREDRVFAALGISGWADANDEHLLILTGLKTSMGDGDETIDSAFPAIKIGGEDVHKPAATAHQQATVTSQGVTGTTPRHTGTPAPVTTPATKPEEKKEGPGLGDDNVPFEDAKPVQDAPGAKTATQTPSEPQTTQVQAGSTVEQGKTEAATPTEALPEPDPAFAKKDGDPDSIASVKVIALNGHISMGQLVTYLRHKRLCRDDQKLADLSEKKLVDIAKHLNSWIPEISKLPR